MTKPLGLYIHIPFCAQKCAYCDFYSLNVSDSVKADYIKALLKEIKQWGDNLSRPIDTIYLGGGTPSLAADFLPKIICEIKNSFNVTDNAEITMEINPADIYALSSAKSAGVNRLSIGVQSGNDNELKALGRRHNVIEASQTFKAARALGFNNISLDLMLGLPNSTAESLEKSLKFITDLGPEHISAYILKIEPNTLFFKTQETLNLPDDDKTAEQYLQMCKYLENKGFEHYEISNFCKTGFESRHNLKYWQLEDYLGLGPAAHSFLNGKRFYYPRDLKGFTVGSKPINDGDGGNEEERIMLSLRLGKGLDITQYKANTKLMERLLLFEKNGLLKITENRIALSNKGMLLSNSIITQILECVL